MSDESQKDESLTKRPSNQNMLLIVIIIALTTILIAGGIGAFFMMRSNSNASTAEPAAETVDSKEDEGKESKAKSADKEKSSKGDKGPAIYNALEPPFVVNFESGAQARFLQVSVQLMTRNAETSQQMKDHEPIIRNDLLFLFSSQTYETISTASGKEELRKKALETVRSVIKQEGGKPDQVEQIFFTSFVMQ